MITHEQWCMARPGEDEPRTERYTTTLDDGRIVATTRCLECGSSDYLDVGRIATPS